MRMRCWRTLPPAYASTIAPFDSATRNCVLGSTSWTVPSVSSISSFAMAEPFNELLRSGRTAERGAIIPNKRQTAPNFSFRLFQEPVAKRLHRRPPGNDLRANKVIGRARLELGLERLHQPAGGEVGVDQRPQ